MKVGLFGIIFNDQREVLLCHRRDYDLWNLPGGGMEPNESPWEGVVREVKEEVSLIVAVLRLSGVYWKPEQQEMSMAFVCEVRGGKESLSDEADQIDYFDIDAMPKHTSPRHVERIRDALESSETLLKVQSGPSSVEIFDLKPRS